MNPPLSRTPPSNSGQLRGIKGFFTWIFTYEQNGLGYRPLRLSTKILAALILMWIFCAIFRLHPINRVSSWVSSLKAPTPAAQTAKAEKAFEAASPEDKEIWLKEAEAKSDQKTAEAFKVHTLQEAVENYQKANADYLALETKYKKLEADQIELRQRQPKEVFDQLAKQRDDAIAQVTALNAQVSTLTADNATLQQKLDAKALLAGGQVLPGNSPVAIDPPVDPESPAAHIAAANGQKPSAAAKPKATPDSEYLDKPRQSNPPATAQRPKPTPRQTLAEKRQVPQGNGGFQPPRSVSPQGGSAHEELVAKIYEGLNMGTGHVTIHRDLGTLCLKGDEEHTISVSEIYRFNPKFKFTNAELEEQMRSRYGGQ